MAKLTTHPRSVYLHEEIDEAVAGAVRMELLARDQWNSDPIRIFINCDGGSWIHAKLLCDFLLRNLRSPIITIVESYAESSAAPLAMCGNLRLAFAESKFMFHDGQPIDDDFKPARIKKWTRRNLRKGIGILKKMEQLLMKETKEYAAYCVRHRSTHLRPCALTAAELERRMIRTEEHKMSVRTALRFGFVDAIIKTTADIDQYEAMLVERGR